MITLEDVWEITLIPICRVILEYTLDHDQENYMWLVFKTNELPMDLIWMWLDLEMER